MADELRTCSHCGLDKPMTDFVADRRKAGGRGYRCKECRKAYRNTQAKWPPPMYQDRYASAARKRIAELGLTEVEPWPIPEMLRIGSIATGIAGIELGLAEKLERLEVAWFCEPEKNCIRLLHGRWPAVPNLGDADLVDWSTVEPVDMLVTGFPCFVAGTLVTSTAGDVPIEQVPVGAQILTHEGRWRSCTSTMSRDGAELLTVRVGGSPDITTTPEHPFFARKRFRRGRGRERCFTDPEWVEAKDLTKDHFVALPMSRPGPVDERIDGPTAYVIGRWLGDGWIVDGQRAGRPVGQRAGKAVICCTEAEESDLLLELKRAGLTPCRSSDKGLPRLIITNRKLVDLLQGFGRGAAYKKIPGWVHNLPTAVQAELVRGWVDADGHTTKAGWRGVTVSHRLAVGMAQVARRVTGMHVAVELHEVDSTTTIEGRTVNQRPWYRLSYSIPSRTPVSFVEDELVWMQVRSTRPAGTGTVYNISVAGDESYFAEGVAVHNCQPFSFAGLRKGEDDIRDLWPTVAIAIKHLQPGYVFIENVPGFLAGPIERTVRFLAEAGYVGRWVSVRDLDLGAPHVRERTFVLAAHPDALGGGRKVGPVLYAPRSDSASERARADRQSGLVRRGGSFDGGEGWEGSWGWFEPAIRRWELMHGPVPAPLDEDGAPNPEVVEWMMGFERGWTRGLARTVRMALLGNSCSPLQAALAFEILRGW